MSNLANLSGNQFTGKISKKERKAQKDNKPSIECGQGQLTSGKTPVFVLQKQIKMLREGAKPYFIPSLETFEANLKKLDEQASVPAIENQYLKFAKGFFPEMGNDGSLTELWISNSIETCSAVALEDEMSDFAEIWNKATEDEKRVIALGLLKQNLDSVK